MVNEIGRERGDEVDPAAPPNEPKTAATARAATTAPPGTNTAPVPAAPVAPAPAPELAPQPPPPEPPKPARIVVGPAWDPAMQVRVAGRRVRLDREQRLEVEAGTYSFSFSLESPLYSFTAQKRIRLEAGAQQRVSIPIEKPGRLTVQPHLNTRPGSVRLDGQAAGPAPLRGRWLQPGEHLVEILPVAGGAAAPALSRKVAVRSDVETVVTFDVDGAIEMQIRERSLAPAARP